MCKLLAYHNFDPNLPTAVGLKINKAIQHLFYINSYGQTDGSGIMYMDEEGSYGYIKDALPSTVFLQLNVFNDIKLDLYKNTFLAAHTRYSTVGGNSWENTHPFEFGKYVGMQNGTIALGCDHKSLVPGTKSPCSVDSASVFWSMDQQGIANTFKQYEGEGVFLFMDVEASTFNIIKNEHRTLHKAKVTGHNVYFYSTDSAAIQLVCDRAALPIDPIEKVPNNTLLTYDLQGTLVETPMQVENDSFTYGYYNRYGTYVNYGTTPSYPTKTNLHNTTSKVIPLPSRAAPTAWDDDDGYAIYSVPITTKPTDDYITDCDFCASPLFKYNMIYSDNPSLQDSKYVCCSSCVKETEEATGASMQLVSLSAKGEY